MQPDPNDSDDALTTLPRAARARGIALRQLRCAAAAGDLPTYRIGAWPRVRPRDVDAWIEAQRRGGPDPR